MVGQPDLGLTGPDVFISYTHVDEAHARAILGVLESHGLNVWWDGMIEAGSVFAKSTEEALDKAKVVLVVWSANSVESHWVRDEAQSGRERNRLVPVSIDGIMPPLGFRQIQSPDLSNWDGKSETPEILGVLEAIKQLLGGEELPTAAAPAALYRSEATVAKNSKRPFALLAALALVALAAAVWFWMVPSRDSEVNSIAILPFENLDEDPERSYFSTGLSEEMRQVFSQNVGLQVAAQASSDFAAGSDQGAAEIAQSLGVRYLLDGSVRRAGNIVRVSVQLIDGATGFDVWSETYERSLDDIFAVQTEIAGQVYGALQLQIAMDSDSGTLRKGGTQNAAAYDAYLRGKSLYALALDEETDRAAQRAFEAAVEADPSYGAAWAALARVQTVIANSYSSGEDLAGAYSIAVESARKAVEVAPDLAESHAALGFVLLNGRLDAEAASGPFEEAYRLGKGDADILRLYATFAARTGDYSAARDAIARSIRLDPLNAVASRTAALIEYSAGDFEAASKRANEALEINPDISVAHRILGDIALLEERYADALAEYGQERSRLSKLPGTAHALRMTGDDDGAEKARQQLIEEFGDNGLYQQAQLLALSGENAKAIDALERAFAANDSGLVLMRGEPMFSTLHDDPRFRALLQRMGFSAP